MTLHASGSLVFRRAEREPLTALLHKKRASVQDDFHRQCGKFAAVATIGWEYDASKIKIRGL
jgi:hypothetical protein